MLIFLNILWAKSRHTLEKNDLESHMASESGFKMRCQPSEMLKISGQMFIFVFLHHVQVTVCSCIYRDACVCMRMIKHA